MGWGSCGTDSKGRHIGYAWPGECDYPGCKTRIDRGLAYACGGMHGLHECLGGSDNVDWGACYVSCEGYYCYEHQTTVMFEHEDGTEVWSPDLCLTCAENLEKQYLSKEFEWLSESPLYWDGELIG